jgi:hypothetical protein
MLLKIQDFTSLPFRGTSPRIPLKKLASLVRDPLRVRLAAAARFDLSTAASLIGVYPFGGRNPPKYHFGSRRREQPLQILT